MRKRYQYKKPLFPVPALLLVSLLSAWLVIACAPIPSARTNDTTPSPVVTVHTAAPPSTEALRMVVLSKVPSDNTVKVRIGQSVQLPTRTPPAEWQLDYDPQFWQPTTITDGPIHQLIAKKTGETELVQRERPGAGDAPAMRQFRYIIFISP